MTDEQIRVAIAEACGWKLPLINDEWGPLRGFKDSTPKTYEVPDYPNDLNAMHEAEKKLSLNQRDLYWNWLARLTEEGRMATAAWLTTTSTARQRAEAFLRTLGKWTE